MTSACEANNAVCLVLVVGRHAVKSRYIATHQKKFKMLPLVASAAYASATSGIAQYRALVDSCRYR